MLSKATIYTALAGVVLGFGYGQWQYERGYDAAEAKRKLDVAELQTKIANEHIASVSRLNALEIAHGEIERLSHEKEAAFSAGVERGRIGLRVNVARCPTQAPNARLGETGAAELAPASRQDYFALRNGLSRQYNDLTRCYATVRELTGG